MSNLDAVKKVMMYQKDKSGFVKEPTVKEMADLVVLVLSQVKVIEQAIKDGRLDGKTPIKDVDYVSKDSAIKMLTKAVNDALSNEEDKFISRVEGKFDSKVYQSEKKRDDVVAGAIDRINTKLSEVKDGVVTEAEIRRAANLALGMIELPDFSELIKENIDGESVRNALSRLTEDKRYKVEISDVNGLAQAIAQVSQIRGQGGTIGKQQVYNFIRQAIADGTISGSGMGDMTAAVYDPANKAEQVVTTGDIGVSVQPAGSYGNVTKVGTPVNNQVGVWTGDGTIEGDTGLTYSGSVLAVTGGITTSVAGTPAQFTRTSDIAASQALIVEGDRATPANNDEVYASFKLSDSAGNQDEMARISVVASDVTSTSEDSYVKIATVVAGTLSSRIQIAGTNLSPFANDGLTLGNTTNQWSDIFLAEGGVINWDNGDATLTQTGNTLALAGADLRVATAGVGTNADSVPTISSTSTLTNKRVNPRTASSTTSATLTPDLSSANVYFRTTQTETLTIGAPTGTPVIGETLLIYVDSAGAQTLTMNATYKVFGSAFPATTTAGKTLMISAQYNGTDWKTLWAKAV